jgi:NAD(P)-dependent dehydrogenase (short-subunit alcohol dehydrogenase family)
MATAVQTESQSNAVVAPAGRLKGKVALITGGTRGIGFAVAQAYVREGAKVILAARKTAELTTATQVLKEQGGDVTASKIDLNSAAACEALYTGAIRAYGRIDILVNNAAILGPISKIAQYRPEEWELVMKTNLDVVYWLSRAVLGTMIPANTGSIINVTSGVGSKGRAGWGAYAVSKAAVNCFTEVLSEEVSQYGIRVNCVDPGATRTEMRAQAFPKEDPATLPKPEEIVNPFIYLASDASKGLTGSILKATDWVGRSF